MAGDDDERVLRVMIGAAWLDREQGWEAFLEEGAMLRVIEADANWWMPRALRTTLHCWC